MSLARERHEKSVSEARNVIVDMSGKLDAGEQLTGTPTVAEVTTNHLSFGNIGVNPAELSLTGGIVPVGHAVQFRVSGGQAGTQYTIRITVPTNSTPAQTLIENIRLKVVADSPS